MQVLFNFGHSEFFDPGVSPVANLFDISEVDGREHFLLGLIIAFVEIGGSRVAAESFVGSDEVYAFAQRIGFSADQIAWSIDRATKRGLIERSPRRPESRGHEQLRVTSAGVYTATILAGMFAYIDAAVVDTPIVDDSYRRLIRPTHDIDERLRRAELFRVYLDGQWRGLGPDAADLPFNWEDHSNRLRTEVERVTQKTRP